MTTWQNQEVVKQHQQKDQSNLVHMFQVLVHGNPIIPKPEIKRVSFFQHKEYGRLATVMLHATAQQKTKGTTKGFIEGQKKGKTTQTMIIRGKIIAKAAQQKATIRQQKATHTARECIQQKAKHVQEVHQTAEPKANKYTANSEQHENSGKTR